MKRFLRQSSLFALLLPFILLFSYPIIWLLLSCFKTDREIFKPMQLFPEKWDPTAFQLLFSDEILNNFSLWSFWGNSMIVSICQALLAVIISASTAYFFVYRNFRGKRLLFMLAVALILIPRQVMIFPLREQMFKMGLFDNLLAVILPGALSGIGILFFIQIYRSLPDDYIHIARLEGASELKTFLTTIPLLAGPFLCCFMIHFLIAWQQHLVPLQLLNDNQVLPVAMKALSSGYSFRYPEALLLVTSLFCIIPSVLLFALTYKKFRSALANHIC